MKPERLEALITEARYGTDCPVSGNFEAAVGLVIKMAWNEALTAAAGVCRDESIEWLRKEAEYLPRGEPHLTAMAAAAGACQFKINALAVPLDRTPIRELQPDEMERVRSAG